MASGLPGVFALGREQVSLQSSGKKKKKEAAHLSTEGSKLAAITYTQNGPCKSL